MSFDRGAYSAEHYRANKEYYKLRSRKRRKVARHFIDRVKRRASCEICSIAFDEVLSFHHIRGKELTLARAANVGASIKRIKSEMRKCIILCENCHRRIHAGTLDLGVTEARLALTQKA